MNKKPIDKELEQCIMILNNQNWQQSHLEKIKKLAGTRYTPKLNVELLISEIFDGISRTKNFYHSIRRHVGKLSREFKRVSSKYEENEIQKLYDEIEKEIKLLLNFLSEIKEFNTAPIPWDSIKSHAQEATKKIWDLLSKLREEKNKQTNEIKKGIYISTSEKIGNDIHHLYQSQNELNYFDEQADSTRAKLSNAPFLKLTGLAGTGKTHLLCDVMESRINRKNPLPSILAFGELFIPGEDPCQQIIKQTSLQGKIGKNNFFRSLDAAGKRAGTRALLIIDALNETRPLKFWKRSLNPIINEVNKYPHIALVISIRSGFEEEVFTKKNNKLFIPEEHKGFQFREWEAVTKFFNEFSLPLPEIPLLMPEFQNPLFLLLFCKAFEKRAKQILKKKRAKPRQIFRGHEGATYIFENFVKSRADQIAAKFNLPKGRNKKGDYVIWDTIIEKIAAEMVEQNNDRIPEDKLYKIVKNIYPSIDCYSFVTELEKNLLLIKVPKYTKQKNVKERFEYRFPFQKFSDHLISRYIFRKYEKEFGNQGKNLVTAKRFFSKRRKLGRFLSLSWNRGIIEALSIQCPEQLKGLEFFEVAPYLKNSFDTKGAFIESLIWRRPNAFTADLKNTLTYINTKVIRTESGNNDLLNAFLSVAYIPEHPFNANFLHKHLSKFTLGKRDSWWSTFLHHQYKERGAVDRLVEWGWSEQDKTHIKDESIKLCAITLAWFLTTSNRFLRDKATKVLVALLTNRINIVTELLKQFKKVNDLYVAERLYAVAYGCALRNKSDRTNLKKIALWIYKNIFKNGKPYPHILFRDYARGTIEVALREKINLHINETQIRPPYKSSWPKRVPSEKVLRKKYYPKDISKDRKYVGIWSSVMHSYGSLADFGNYVLDSAVGHWSGRKLDDRTQVNRKQLFEEFKNGLTKKQKELLNKTDPFYGINIQEVLKKIHAKTKNTNPTKDTKLGKKKIKEKSKELTKLKKERFNEFKKSLNHQKRDFFKKEIEPFFDEGFRINDPLEMFNYGLAQRWVFNRVVQLGWKPELHGEFDRLVNYNRIDRSEHKSERIGKKYQWIAFHELIARVADNFEMKEESWSDKTSVYQGPWQLGVRDIDPSCTLKEYPNLKPKSLPTFNLYKKKFAYNFRDKKLTDLKWLKRVQDLPDPKPIIEYTADDNSKWIALEGFAEWQEETPPEQEKYDFPTRRFWYMIKSYLVKKRDFKKVYTWARKQNFMGRWMPESHEFYKVFLGEYPWAPAFLYHYIPYFNHDGWTDEARFDKITAKVLVTDDGYLSSGSSVDCSVEEAIRVKLPAKWIVDKMKLKQVHIDGMFFNKKNELVAFDPYVFDKNFPKVLLVKREELCDFLNNKGYSIFWTLLGEKNMIGRDISGKEWIGRLEINGAYLLSEKNKITGSTNNKFITKGD